MEFNFENMSHREHREDTEIQKGKMDINKITDLYPLGQKIIQAAIEVHKILGTGLLESAYQKALGYELEKPGLDVLFFKPPCPLCKLRGLCDTIFEGHTNEIDTPAEH